MRITLNYHEGRSILSRAPDWVEEYLRETRRHTWSKSHVYAMPAVGWRDLLRLLYADAYGPRGGRASTATSLYTGMGKIAEAVATFEMHPAFFGNGMVDGPSTVIPAFMWAGKRSPYPNPDLRSQFIVLMPRHQKLHGHHVVTWAPASDWELRHLPEDPLYCEEIHVRFAAKGSRETEHLRSP